MERAVASLLILLFSLTCLSISGFFWFYMRPGFKRFKGKYQGRRNDPSSFWTEPVWRGFYAFGALTWFIGSIAGLVAFFIALFK